MSGIAGIIRFDGAPVEPGQIEAMTAAMAHRGPDGIAHWYKGPVALGHCMLRTTPESLEEAQPLANEDQSLILVIDGRVDNWVELRAELLKRGAQLRTRADAELVLRAFETWGRDCLAHIDGDFAFVIWDARRRTAFCARDRMGHKPFHYHWDGRTFAFASELHPILALPWVEERANDGMLAQYLAWEFHARDETLWHGVKRLVAGHSMVVDARPPTPRRYWAPRLDAVGYSNDVDYIEHYRALFADSVRRMARTHRPLACEVSGGLDSSAVFAMAEHLRRGGTLGAPALEGYTLAFAADSPANELAYARAVGNFLDRPLREVAPVRLPLDAYAERARVSRDFPGYPNGAMGRGLRQQAAGAGSRAILTGEWGDALLAGSRAYYAEELAQRNWRALATCLHADASAAGARYAALWLLRDGVLPLLPAAVRHSVRQAVRAMRGGRTLEDLCWLSPPMREALAACRETQAREAEPLVRRYAQRAMLEMLNSAFTSQVLEHAEREAAYAGLEMRHPLGDARLVELALATPERLRLRGYRSKHLHREALRDRLPQIVLERRTKAEFSDVFRGHLDAMEEHFASTLPERRDDWLDRDGMRRLFDAYRKNRQFGRFLWILWGIYGSDCVCAGDL